MRFKVFWFVRMFFYSIFYKRISWKGYFGKPIYLMGLKNIEIGEKVRILPGARMESHLNGVIKIRNNVSIGQNIHIISQGKVSIGSGVLISGNVLITSVDHCYVDISIPVINQPHIVKDTVIGENCFIGYGVVIQAGSTLGKHCIVGSNSVVRGAFPDYSVIVGSPAKVIKTFDEKNQKWEKVINA